jgi:hypothetical protein
MAYLKPAWIRRKIVNPIAMLVGIGGVETLSFRKRGSGDVQKVPLFPIDYESNRYIVSVRGESDWVRNVRAAGGKVQVQRRGAAEMFQAIEVPVAKRAPILAAYRRKFARIVEPYWKKLPDPSDHPVFRLELIGRSDTATTRRA